MSILKKYILAKRLRKKRQIIHRFILFSEPVHIISLDTILNKNRLDRTEYNTDKSELIRDISYLNKKQINKFEKSWYFTMYDVKRSEPYDLYKEIDLPKNAIKEIKNDSNNRVNIEININETVLESVNRNESISKLINSYNWRFLLLYEYSIIKNCHNKIYDLLNSEEIRSKKELIDRLYDNDKKARYNSDIISNMVNASEEYVKDVISGRTEYSLSKEERENILERDNYMCQNCLSEDNLEVHHIIPISKGGDKEDKNLCTLCFDCHFNIAHGESTAEISYSTIEEFWDMID